MKPQKVEVWSIHNEISKYIKILANPSITAEYIIKIEIEKNALQYENCPLTYKSALIAKSFIFVGFSVTPATSL